MEHIIRLGGLLGGGGRDGWAAIWVLAEEESVACVCVWETELFLWTTACVCCQTPWMHKTARSSSVDGGQGSWELVLRELGATFGELSLLSFASGSYIHQHPCAGWWNGMVSVENTEGLIKPAGGAWLSCQLDLWLWEILTFWASFPCDSSLHFHSYLGDR